MAIRHSMEGKLLIEGASMTELADATLTINSKVAEADKIGGTWTRSTSLTRKASFSFTANYDPTDTVQAALVTGFTSGDVEFSGLSFYDNASAYFGDTSVIITSASITKSFGGYDKLTCSFDFKEAVGSWS